MDSDYLEGRGRDVEVREPGVLQVVEVALGQSVPGVNNTESHAKLENPCKMRHKLLDKLYIMKLILAQETKSRGKYLTSNPSELLWILHLAPQNNSF